MLAPGRLVVAVGIPAVLATAIAPVSAAVAVKPLSAPQNFKISRNIFTKSATISWTPPKPNGQPITGYKVAQSGAGSFSKLLGPGARSYRFSLHTGVLYTLSVRAVTATQTGPAASGSVEF